MTDAPGVETITEQFSTDPTGLPEAQASRVVDLDDGEEFELRIGPVAKPLGDTTVRMLAYNRADYEFASEMKEDPPAGRV